jgi:hypothetical protein
VYHGNYFTDYPKSKITLNPFSDSKREGGYTYTRLLGSGAKPQQDDHLINRLTGDLEEETEVINGMGSGDTTRVCNSNTIFQEDKSSPAKFWTSKGFVNSFEEWKLDQETNKKTSLYPANVTSIERQPYGTILKDCGFVFGSNEKPTNDDCGKLFRKIQCSQNSLHHQSFRHLHCNDPGCPVCYSKYSGQMADRITERVQGHRTVYRRYRVYHLIFWPEPRDGRPYAGLTEAFKDGNRMLKNMGVEGAVTEYHPYRIRKELKPILRRYKIANGLNGKVGFWKLAHDDVLGLGGLENYLVSGPHFHGVATGFLMDIRDYSKKYGGAGYKKKRYLDSEKAVHEVAYYISTHAGREAGKSSVRYYGTMSYRMLAREEVESRIEDVRCPVCQAKLLEFDCDDTGMTLQQVKDNVTEKVKYFLYWKKGQPKPDMATHAQCLISRFSRDL